MPTAAASSANAAIYFHAEGYRTDQPKLMGRHAAGEGFLKGMLDHAAVGELVAYAESGQQFELFERLCREMGGRNAALPRAWAGPGREAALTRAGALMLPGPNLAEQGWRRRRGDPRRWSVCGVTHTTASHRAMDSVGEFLTGPVEPWDALICTSTAVLRTVERILDGYGRWLRQRLGAVRLPRPQLPVIPLGIDCAALDPGAAEAKAARKAWRQRLGIGDADLMVLFVGRLSWHAKAHPLPMYMGLQQAAARLGKNVRLHLVESGWHANDWIRDGFAEAQKALMPDVRCHLVDGREPEARRGIWHAADLFCSLSDNIQETYGLTPVEAMAAGLPVVASDWDGYRDTLVHGETALLVPTVLPLPEAGIPFAERHEDGRDSYDHYCAQASLVTAVDVPATGAALTALLAEPQRRAAMGAAGRARALALYDWRVVIGRYQELWAELAAIRRSPAAGTAAIAGPAGTAAIAGPAETAAGVDHIGTAVPDPDLAVDIPPHPLRDNPFHLFGHYATRSLGPDSRLCLLETPPATAERVAGLRMNRLDNRAAHPSPLTLRLLARLQAAGGAGIAHAALLAEFPPGERRAVAMGVGWLLKTGLIAAD